MLQDQRTARTAAFILAAPGWTGSCFLGDLGSGSGGWRSDPLPALTGPIAVDEQGGDGGVGSPSVTLQGGRTAPGVVHVTVQLPDGKIVVASVGNGHWLAWWTPGAAPESIAVTAAGGSVDVLRWDGTEWTLQ